MKTLTEFSGVVLRQAARARQEKLAAGVEADALTEAIGAEIGVTGDRLVRLLEALDAIKVKLDPVRLVRVYQGESAPPRAFSAGEFHYVVDMVASSGGHGDGRRGRRGERGQG